MRSHQQLIDQLATLNPSYLCLGHIEFKGIVGKKKATY